MPVCDFVNALCTKVLCVANVHGSLLSCCMHVCVCVCVCVRFGGGGGSVNFFMC